MIVCLCEIATDKDISLAIAEGAHTVDQVGERCGAGTGCGTCRGFIGEMIEKAQARCPGTGYSDCPRMASHEAGMSAW